MTPPERRDILVVGELRYFREALPPMPTYDYKCEKCGAIVELSHGFDEKPRKTCLGADCDGRLRRVFSPPTIIFKGSGWHVTDYGRGNGKSGKPGKNGKSETSTDVSEKVEKAKASIEKSD